MAEPTSAGPAVRPFARSAGACLVAIPLPLVAGVEVHGIGALGEATWVLAVVLASSVLLAIASARRRIRALVPKRRAPMDDHGVPTARIADRTLVLDRAHHAR